MSEDRIDRLQAEELSELLDVPVTAISEDADVVTRELWAILLGSMPLPESIDTRWECLAGAFMGWLP